MHEQLTDDDTLVSTFSPELQVFLELLGFREMRIEALAVTISPEKGGWVSLFLDYTRFVLDANGKTLQAGDEIAREFCQALVVDHAGEILSLPGSRVTEAFGLSCSAGLTIDVKANEFMTIGRNHLDVMEVPCARLAAFNRLFHSYAADITHMLFSVTPSYE
jgi:hypothetical protein